MGRRAVTRGMATQLRTPVQEIQPAVRNFASKSASPETPLMHYQFATNAGASMNHRFFYLNIIAMVFVVDAGSGLVDLWVRVSLCSGSRDPNCLTQSSSWL